jgi:hypothetical protein
VEVKVPTSWNLLPSDRFPELFAASLGDALSREGLTVPITALRSVEDPTKATYVLKVEITDWKMANAGDIACTFTASLKTPVDERRLGEYSRMRWAPGVIYSNSNHAYYPTQLDGLRALARDLDRSELLHEPPTLHFASMNR